VAAHRLSQSSGGRRNQHGVAAIEFAMVLTVLLLILLAIIGYGAIFWAQQQLSAAAGEGARAGLQAHYSGSANAQLVACQAAEGLFGAGTSVECNRTAMPVTCTWAGANTADVECMEIVLRYDVAQWPLLRSFQGLLGFVSGGDGVNLVPRTLSARAIIQITQEPL